MFCTGIFNAWNLFEAIINQVLAAKTSVWFSPVAISYLSVCKNWDNSKNNCAAKSITNNFDHSELNTKI